MGLSSHFFLKKNNLNLELYFSMIMFFYKTSYFLMLDYLTKNHLSVFGIHEKIK